MSLAVVIKCGNDPRIHDCIASIDIPVEVVAAGFFSTELSNSLRRIGINTVDAPRGNLGKTANRGVEAASSARIVLMDSDSWFTPGTLARFAEALDRAAVAKAKVLYLADDRVRGSSMVAATRQHLNDSLGRAYTPGLGFRKEIKEAIGGYFFHEGVHYTEDAEFDFRLRRAGIPLSRLEGGGVCHVPVTCWHDLRAAYRYGYGKAQQVTVAGRENDEDIIPFVKRLARGEQCRTWRSWVRELGIAGAFYNSSWSVLYYLGYTKGRVLDG